MQGHAGKNRDLVEWVNQGAPWPETDEETRTEKETSIDWEKFRHEHWAFRPVEKPSLPAVTNHRIYFPDQDLLLRPGPRVGQAARVLADMLHPECFDE